MAFKLSALTATLSIALFSHSAYAASAEQQLNNLQAELNQLNQQVQSSNKASSVAVVSTDSQMPMGTLSKVHFPIAILQAKNLLSSPLVMGGQIEADAQGWRGSYIDSNDSQTGTAVALTKLYLFNMANLSNWATAVVSLKNSLPSNGLAVDRAFLVLGNVSQSPWYFTAGNAYLPFGSFSGNGPLDNSLTTNAFRVNPTSQAMLGLNAYGFDTDLGLYSANRFDNGLHDFLLNTEWTAKLNSSSQLTLGGGYLNDIRGTSSGLGAAYASSTPSTNSPLSAAKTAAYDANLNYSIANLSLLAEYLTTSRSAIANNQSIGKPSVWMIGTVYKHAMLNWPTQFQLSFSQSQNMQNVPLPIAVNFLQNLKATGIKTEWLASVVSQVWSNTYIGPELDYDHMYAGTHNWTLSMDATAYF